MSNNPLSPKSGTRPLFVPFGREGDAVQGEFAVDRVSYLNRETGFAVLRLVPVDGATVSGFVAVGEFGQPQSGECYAIEGKWQKDARFGLQVKVSSSMRVEPKTLAAIERYVAGTSIKGLGPSIAKALVERFGDDTLQVLQEGGKRLQQVSGIGPVRAQMIQKSWAEHQGLHDLMIKLQGVAGLTTHQAQRIYRQYGLKSWEMVSTDPFRLAEEVRGFGFKTCDAIGRKLGLAHDAPQRLQAAMIYLLNEALRDGHLWTGKDELLHRGAELLNVPEISLASQLDLLLTQDRLMREEIESGSEAFFLPRVFFAEQRVAEILTRWLMAPRQAPLTLNEEDARAMAERHGHPSLTEEQRRIAIDLLQGDRLLILTGGPGTGKTTTIRSVIACLEQMEVTYALCATTGRASKQLAMATERMAATVHRHLGIGRADMGLEPIAERVLVIDEASMIDLWLLEEIVSRLTDQTQLILVGDIDQLPSVGPGAVLQDLMRAGEELQLPGIHVARLSRIFRQEAGSDSMIVVNCHRVREGERPIAQVPQDSDYFEMHRETPEEARQLAVELAATRLPKYLGVPPSEVQVLAPMYSGQAGIRVLNLELQNRLNPPAADKAEFQFAQRDESTPGRVFRVGDKVRQTRNDYQKQVFNGDLGHIVNIDNDAGRLVVAFDDHEVAYDLDDIDELVHSWAMTIHAAQGSQWPAVVVLLLRHHYVMLERNILYTALSRAQRMAVLITQDAAVRIAVARARAIERRTRLTARLSELMLT